MPDDAIEPLSDSEMVNLLRTKADQLYADIVDPLRTMAIEDLATDVALIARLLATEIERRGRLLTVEIEGSADG